MKFSWAVSAATDDGRSRLCTVYEHLQGEWTCSQREINKKTPLGILADSELAALFPDIIRVNSL